MDLCKKQVVDKAFCVGVHRMSVDWHCLGFPVIFVPPALICLNLWREDWEPHHTFSSSLPKITQKVCLIYITPSLFFRLEGTFRYQVVTFILWQHFCRWKPNPAVDICFKSTSFEPFELTYYSVLIKDILAFPFWTEENIVLMLRQMETVGRQFVLGSPEVKDVDSCRWQCSHIASVDGSRVAF